MNLAGVGAHRRESFGKARVQGDRGAEGTLADEVERGANRGVQIDRPQLRGLRARVI